MVEGAKKANPISPKVYAAAAGAGLGTVLTTLLLWLIGAAISHRWTADGVDNALAAVPGPLAAFVAAAIIIGGTMLGTYLKSDPLRLPTLDEGEAYKRGLIEPNRLGPRG